ncbi:hypothetical protein [Paenibacillus foliorum]|uniref:hypothetical protein n=1 Tax=Paenibacillus foliorum TaxID=2654974 RepID=UPI001491FF7E|nr:hypothetical protein [Paenibacillus foliorum]
MMEKLEGQNLILEQKLLEVAAITDKAAITEDTLRQLLSQFGARLANRALPDFIFLYY